MSKYSAIPDNAIFKADGNLYKKNDAMYYEDLTSGFQSVWSPMFDATIDSTTASTDPAPSPDEPEFITDPSSRLMKRNPNFVKKQSDAEKWFGEMWGTGDFDCGPEEYQYMAQLGACAYGAMKELCKLVGLDDAFIMYPGVVDILTKAYAKSLEEPVAPVKKTPAKKKAVVKTAAKKQPAKKATKRK